MSLTTVINLYFDYISKFLFKKILFQTLFENRIEFLVHYHYIRSCDTGLFNQSWMVQWYILACSSLSQKLSPTCPVSWPPPPTPPVLHILLFYKRHIFNFPSSHAVLRIRIRDPVPFWPLNPRSGMVFFRIPDPGSRIPDLGSRISDPGSQTHIFESLVTIFGVKSCIVLRKLAQIFFFSISKIK